MSYSWCWVVSLVFMAGLFSCSAERLARKAMRKDPSVFNMEYRPVSFDLKMQFDSLATVRYIAKVDSFFQEKDWPDSIKTIIVQTIPVIVEGSQQIPVTTDTVSKVWPDSSWVHAWVHQGRIYIEGELHSVEVKKKEKTWEKISKYAIGFGSAVVLVFLLVLAVKVRP